LKSAPQISPLSAAAALTAASLAVLAAAPAQYLGRQQDDLLYLISSHALLGGGYRLFTTPGAPPLTMITPGFPALLLPVTWIFGERHAAHQVVCVLIQAGIPWLLWAWLRRRCEESVAVLISLLWATSPIVLSQAGTVMTEATYTGLSVALLLGLEQNRSGGYLGALLLALTQIRPAGLSLLPAALAPALSQGRRREAVKIIAWPTLGVLLWSAWSYSVSGEVQEIREVALSYEGHPWLYPLAVAWDNAGYYLSSWGGCYLPRSWSSAGWAAGTGLAALSAIGCRNLLKRDKTEPAVFLLAGAGLMHAFWAWQYERYLIPLLPWLLWTAAQALGRRARPALATLLAAQVIFHAWIWVNDRSPWKTPELAETYAWLRAEGRPSDILSSLLYVRDGYYALRPSVPLPDRESSADFAAALKARRVRRLLWQEKIDVGLSAGKTASIQRLLDRASRHLETPGLFRLVHEEPSESARVYEVR
jgi:hypothetical protein